MFVGRKKKEPFKVRNSAFLINLINLINAAY